ncbi:MAG: hypothetical protein M3R38_17105 [Actinomycetota bacterium]|nr:hypothetical protein [Actinomycetota bacterium]
MQHENPATETLAREELTERVLRIEGQLNGLLARLIGRARVMKMMGARPVLEGVLWLHIAERVDRRGVDYHLAAVLKDVTDHDPWTGETSKRTVLRFDVTHLPDGDIDASDTARFRDARQALDTYHRIGPFWNPEG